MRSRREIGAHWEFHEEGNAEGWEPLCSLSHIEITGGTFKAVVTGPDPALSGPPCAFPASEFGSIHLRVRVTGATFGTLVWETDSTSVGIIGFPFVGDRLFHDCEIPVHTNQAWAGQIRSCVSIISETDFPLN